MRPELSVIVPTSGRERVLRSAVASILAQTGVELEVLVVLDGVDIDLWPEGPADPRVRVVHHDRRAGAAAARMTGLARTRSPWVAFCDDDDVWAPGKAAAQLAALRARPGHLWSCTGAVAFAGEGEVVAHQPAVDGDVLRCMLANNEVPGGGSGVIAATDVVRDVGGFDSAVASSEDWDLWIRLAARSPVVGVDAPLVGYRLSTDGKSLDTARMKVAWAEIADRYADVANTLGVVPDRARHRQFLARQALRSGRRVSAAQLFAEAALASGQLGPAVRSGVALLAPDLMRRGGVRRSRNAVPAQVLAEVAEWLPAACRAGSEVGPPAVGAT